MSTTVGNPNFGCNSRLTKLLKFKKVQKDQKTYEKRFEDKSFTVWVQCMKKRLKFEKKFLSEKKGLPNEALSSKTKLSPGAQLSSRKNESESKFFSPETYHNRLISYIVYIT